MILLVLHEYSTLSRRLLSPSVKNPDQSATVTRNHPHSPSHAVIILPCHCTAKLKEHSDMWSALESLENFRGMRPFLHTYYNDLIRYNMHFKSSSLPLG